MIVCTLVIQTFGHHTQYSGVVFETMVVGEPCLFTFLSHFITFQGDLDEALLLCERALAIREKALGPSDPESLDTRATLLRVQVKAVRTSPG